MRYKMRYLAVILSLAIALAMIPMNTLPVRAESYSTTYDASKIRVGSSDKHINGEYTYLYFSNMNDVFSFVQDANNYADIYTSTGNEQRKSYDYVIDLQGKTFSVNSETRLGFDSFSAPQQGSNITLWFVNGTLELNASITVTSYDYTYSSGTGHSGAQIGFLCKDAPIKVIAKTPNALVADGINATISTGYHKDGHTTFESTYDTPDQGRKFNPVSYPYNYIQIVDSSSASGSHGIINLRNRGAVSLTKGTLVEASYADSGIYCVDGSLGTGYGNGGNGITDSKVVGKLYGIELANTDLDATGATSGYTISRSYIKGNTYGIYNHMNNLDGYSGHCRGSISNSSTVEGKTKSIYSKNENSPGVNDVITVTSSVLKGNVELDNTYNSTNSSLTLDNSSVHGSVSGDALVSSQNCYIYTHNSSDFIDSSSSAVTVSSNTFSIGDKVQIVNGTVGLPDLTSQSPVKVWINENGDVVTGSVSKSSVYNENIITLSECNHAITEIRNDKAATCMATGYTGDTYCTVCGAKIASGSTIPKLSHTLVAHGRQEPTCTEDGHKAYWTCDRCQNYFEDSSATTPLSQYEAQSVIVIPATGHNMTHYDAVAPTCTGTGQIEYWHCSNCNKDFTSSTGGTPTTNLVVSALGHTLTKTSAVTPTCTEDGNIDYWTCSRCKKYFSDENASTEITLAQTVVNKTGHRMTHHDAVSPQCTVDGNSEYWTCENCHKHFSDENGDTEVTLAQTVVAKTGHRLTHHDAVSPQCTVDGNIEYWTCDNCGKYFTDANGEHEVTQADTVVNKTGHDMEYVSAVAPTCLDAGNISYHYCNTCHKYFADGNGETELTEADTIIAATGHNLTKHDAVSATCTDSGHYDYWTCSNCNGVFADAEATRTTTVLDMTTTPLGHSLQEVVRVEPTCTNTGNIKHYVCTRCSELFADEDAITPITEEDTIISAKGHREGEPVRSNVVEPTCTENGSYVETIYCTECEEQLHQETKSIPAKGHSLTHYDAVAATCTAAGNIEYYRCSDCGKLFTDELGQNSITEADTVVSAKGHTPGAKQRINEVSPTCTESGSYTEIIKCTVCDTVLESTDKTVEPLGHDWGEWTVITPPTEESKGVEERVCKHDNTHKETRDIPELAHVHKLVTHEAKAPTCQAEGNILYYTCSGCNGLFVKNGDELIQINPEDIIVAKSSHTPGEPVQLNIVAPTCEVDGSCVEEIKCADCGTVISTTNKILPAIGHDWGDWVVITPPTETAKGVEERVCKHDSSHKETREISELSHKHSLIFMPKLDADCTHSGTMEHYECATCYKYFKDKMGTQEVKPEDLVIKATGHKLTVHAAKSPTCVSTGNVKYSVCSTCGKLFLDDGTETTLSKVTIPVSDHHITMHLAKEPTCTELGNYTYFQCDVCNELYADRYGMDKISRDDIFVAPLGHALVHVDAKSPAIGVQGNIEHWKCANCGKCFLDMKATKSVAKSDIIIPAQTAIKIGTGCTVNAISVQAYTGKAIKPSIKIVDKTTKKALKLGTDYTVTYKDNVKPGKASVIITGKGNYTGTLTKKFLIKKPVLKYRSYVQKSGWEKTWSSAVFGSSTNTTKFSGTTKNLLLEGFQMKLSGINGYVRYRAYVQKTGWQAWKSTKDAKISGTKTSKRVEAIQLEPKGQIGELYDIYYRVYVDGNGWLGWAKNGAKAGSAGYSKKIRAIQVQVVPKTVKFNTGSKKAFISK